MITILGIIQFTRILACTVMVLAGIGVCASLLAERAGLAAWNIAVIATLAWMLYVIELLLTVMQ